MQRHGQETAVGYHQAKRNLALWVRRGKNMRDPVEISAALKMANELVWDAAYQHSIEPGFYNKYLVYPPENVKFFLITLKREENNQGLQLQTRGLNFIHVKKFGNKTKFFRRFVNGVRPLL